MIRCFLSHSSNDKARYVEIVARKLTQHNCVYDTFVFEEGMKTIEEILNGLDQSQIFVIFLSDAALKSDCVQFELKSAYDRLKQGQLRRIFPIIIDPNISHKDPRIPEWMVNEYNLKLISRPTVAARRIEQKMRELSWDYHPRLNEKGWIFVVRN